MVAHMSDRLCGKGSGHARHPPPSPLEGDTRCLRGLECHLALHSGLGGAWAGGAARRSYHSAWRPRAQHRRHPAHVQQPVNRQMQLNKQSSPWRRASASLMAGARCRRLFLFSSLEQQGPAQKASRELAVQGSPSASAQATRSLACRHLTDLFPPLPRPCLADQARSRAGWGSPRPRSYQPRAQGWRSWCHLRHS